MKTRHIRLFTVLAFTAGAARSALAAADQSSPWGLSIYGGDSVPLPLRARFSDAHDAQSRWAFPVALAATYHFE